MVLVVQVRFSVIINTVIVQNTNMSYYHLFEGTGYHYYGLPVHKYL